jgi:superfamily I DNA and/or RNA helicase
VINSIQFQIKGENGDADTLIRAIRRIPTNDIAMKDNGKSVLRIAVTRLERSKDDYLKKYIDQLKQIMSSDVVEYEKFKVLKREILVHIIPKERIFTGQGKREEIDLLLCEISEYLHKQIQQSKKGEDLFLEYMQNLEDNPMAVKKTILEYSVVNGATNQQVMSKEISDLKNNDIVYDNVLVDEAARSNPLDLFIPMSVAKDKIIMVGDHRQLPHIIDDEVVRKLEDETPESDLKEEIDERLKQSMFQQLFYKLQNLEKQEPQIPRVITLDRQFRMHPSIGSFINNNFYKVHGENVENGITNIKNFEHSLPGLKDKACVWYDTPLSLGKERSDKSKSRYIEAKRIAEHLKKMLDSPEGKKYSYGIITFYRDQVDKINEVLATKEFGILVKSEGEHYSISPNYWKNTFGDEEYIKVGTVDAFQGREFDVVYLSMVRSNDDKVEEKPALKKGTALSAEDRKILTIREKQLRKKYGFLMFENRLCVAMSRGKKLLICVGDSGMLKTEAAEEAIPSLINFYNLCNGGDQYGYVIK